VTITITVPKAAFVTFEDDIAVALPNDEFFLATMRSLHLIQKRPFRGHYLYVTRVLGLYNGHAARYFQRDGAGAPMEAA